MHAYFIPYAICRFCIRCKGISFWLHNNDDFHIIFCDLIILNLVFNRTIFRPCLMDDLYSMIHTIYRSFPVLVLFWFYHQLLVNWCIVFTHIVQGCFTDNEAIVILLLCPWGNLEVYCHDDRLKKHCIKSRIVGALLCVSLFCNCDMPSIDVRSIGCYHRNMRSTGLKMPYWFHQDNLVLYTYLEYVHEICIYLCCAEFSCGVIIRGYSISVIHIHISPWLFHWYWLLTTGVAVVQAWKVWYKTTSKYNKAWTVGILLWCNVSLIRDQRPFSINLVWGSKHEKHRTNNALSIS